MSKKGARSRSESKTTTPIPILIAIGFTFHILLLGFIIVPGVYKFFFKRKSRRFNEYLRSEEMQTIKRKYFSDDIQSHLLIMNRVIIDDVDTLCIFPLNEHARQIIDEGFSHRFETLTNRLYFRFLFLNIFFRFSRFTKKFYIIQNSFGSETSASTDPNCGKQRLQQNQVKTEEDINKGHQEEGLNNVDLEKTISFDSSEEDPQFVTQGELCNLNETPGDLSFNAKWIKKGKFNKRFLYRIDYYHTSLFSDS